jgi:hypothetical protein
MNSLILPKVVYTHEGIGDRMPTPFVPEGFRAPLTNNPVLQWNSKQGLSVHEMEQARIYFSPGAKACFWWEYRWNAEAHTGGYREEHLWLLLEATVLQWTHWNGQKDHPVAVFQLRDPNTESMADGTIDIHVTLLLLRAEPWAPYIPPQC